MMMSRVKLAWPAIEAVETFYLQCLQKGCKITCSIPNMHRLLRDFVRLRLLYTNMRRLLRDFVRLRLLYTNMHRLLRDFVRLRLLYTNMRRPLRDFVRLRLLYTKYAPASSRLVIPTKHCLLICQR